MKVYVLILIVALGLSACQWGETSHQKPDFNKDTLAFTYDTIKVRASDCGNKADSLCSVASIIYPRFKNEKALTDAITQKLISSGFNNPDKKRDTSLHSFAEDFIAGYVKDNPKQYSPEMFYTLNLKAMVVRQDSSLTTLQLEGYTYEGGAHGASSTTFINWNPKSKSNITLAAVLTDDYYAKLTAVADTIFRRQEQLSDTSSLARDYFFKDNKFALNDNYMFTPIGIRFLYNQYEIKPYAAGTTDLFVPYTRIRSLLRPNTVITQYIK
ncbi:DUF3298 domain-containing protein [Mucilaginibacter sp. HD30]